jgi:HD-like signal output (HDOD) protein
MVDKNRRNSSASDASKRERISRKITRIIDDLPLFPTDINQLLAAAVKPVEDGTELLRLIESDPRLRSQLLALASSYFGWEEDFKSIEDAVQHMGVRSLVQLIGISFARDVIKREFTALKYLNDYIDHGEDIYIASDILGGICSLPREQRQIHALAGLVHDVGRLAIMIAGNETGARVLGTLWDRMVSVVHQEKAELGMDHCDVGARICRKWNFSPVIQEAVLRHHSPIMNGDFSFAGALIFLSHFVAASDPSGEILATLLATKVLKKLDLTPVDFERARDQYESRTQNSN